MINSSIRPNEILIASNLSTIRILDLKSYTFTLDLTAHDKRINCLEFMTDEILLSSSSDLTIKIWNLDSTKTSLQTIDCAQDEAMILRKINETTFACLSYDGLIKIFSSDKECILFKCYKTINQNSGYAKDLKVCSDINVLICPFKVIHLYSLTDFTCVGTLSQNMFFFARSIAILPNNRLIAANKNQTLQIWCLKTCQSLSIHKDHSSLTNNILFYNN
jgi:WD40 repeat protein